MKINLFGIDTALKKTEGFYMHRIPAKLSVRETVKLLPSFKVSTNRGLGRRSVVRLCCARVRARV